MITFEKLRTLVKARGLSIYHLKSQKVVSSSTVDRLRTDTENVSTDTINRVCAYYGVQPSDIMEYIPDITEGE